MFRKDLDEHLREHCQSRKFIGKKGKQHSAITSPLHLCVRTHLPVECSNDCQLTRGIMRKDLKNHLDKECTKRQVYCEYSRTSIIRPSIIRNLDYPAWQFSCYQIRNWACPSNAHARCSCYHGYMPAFLLRMRIQPCGTAVYQ